MPTTEHLSTFSITVPTRFFNKAEAIAEHMGITTDRISSLIYDKGLSEVSRDYGAMLHTEDLMQDGSAP